MNEEKLTTKEFIEMWYEHYQKRLNFVLENKAGYDHNKLMGIVFKAHRDTMAELDLALSNELSSSLTLGKGADKIRELFAYFTEFAPTKDSLRYNDERIMNNANPEDFDWEDLDGFDRLIKLKDTSLLKYYDVKEDSTTTS